MSDEIKEKQEEKKAEETAAEEMPVKTKEEELE